MGSLLFISSILFAGLGVLAAFNFFRASADRKGERDFVFNLSRALPAWAVAALLFLMFLSFTSVDAGQIGVVKRLGNPVRELSPGAHFIVPIIDSVTPVIVQTRIVKPSEDAASLDLQIVHAEVTLAYHVDPSHATDILVQLNDDAENRVIAPAIFEAIKAVTARYTVQELISERPKVRDGIEAFVTARLAPYHIIAETVSITDFKFSHQFEQAIEAKVTAQQLAEKAENDLNRIKVEADQKVAQAKGEAEALRAQKEQVTPELLQLRTIEMMRERWDGRLPEVLTGQGALPMLDVLKAAGHKGETK